jgi:FdhE protein
MPIKSSNTADPIIQRLRSLAKDWPDLKDAAKLYEAILPLLRDADLHVGTISLTPEQVRAKMEAGMPLLHDVDIDLDVEAVRELMIKLARAVKTASKKNSWHKLRLPWLQTSSEPASAARQIRTALEENKLDVGALLPHIAAGDNGPVTTAAQTSGLDPGLLMTLARNALKPALRAWCRQLSPLAKGLPWQKGSCFVCGAEATLAELQENYQIKHLRCGQCGADWQFPRMVCLHCGNEDPYTQRYLAAEGRLEKMRVEVCDKCHGYLKVINSFTPTLPEMLTVEDLATLHLDYIAKARGYARRAVR